MPLQHPPSPCLLPRRKLEDFGTAIASWIFCLPVWFLHLSCHGFFTSTFHHHDFHWHSSFFHISKERNVDLGPQKDKDILLENLQRLLLWEREFTVGSLTGFVWLYAKRADYFFFSAFLLNCWGFTRILYPILPCCCHFWTSTTLLYWSVYYILLIQFLWMFASQWNESNEGLLLLIRLFEILVNYLVKNAESITTFSIMTEERRIPQQ